MNSNEYLADIKAKAYMTDSDAIEFCARTGVSLDALCLLRLLSRKVVRQSHVSGYADGLEIPSPA